MFCSSKVTEMDKVEAYLDKIQQEQIALVLSIGGLLMTAYRLYKDYLTRAARACANLDPKEKRLCMLKYKIDGKRKQLATLTSLVAKCRQTKNPDECLDKLRQKIESCRQQLDYFRERYNAEKEKP